MFEPELILFGATEPEPNLNQIFEKSWTWTVKN